MAVNAAEGIISPKILPVSPKAKCERLDEGTNSDGGA
jgi:hypothetical protein